MPGIDPAVVPNSQDYIYIRLTSNYKERERTPPADFGRVFDLRVLSPPKGTPKFLGAGRRPKRRLTRSGCPEKNIRTGRRARLGALYIRIICTEEDSPDQFRGIPLNIEQSRPAARSAGRDDHSFTQPFYVLPGTAAASCPPRSDGYHAG